MSWDSMFTVLKTQHRWAKAHAAIVKSLIKFMCQDLMHWRMSAIISVKITTTDVTAIIRLLREKIDGAGCLDWMIKFIAKNKKVEYLAID